MVANFKQIQKYFNEQAQAIVEFAIVLPILLAMLVGILEVGRMVFIYGAINNASREAVRYASAWGLRDDGTTEKFNDCTGIKEMAARSAFFVPLTIEIYKDTGPGSTSTQYCGGSIDADDISLSTKDRVTVKVIAPYKPMVNLIPLPQRNFESTSSRTMLGILNLTTGGGSSSTTGGGGSSSTSTPTAWNPTGGPNSKPMTLKTASLGGNFWTGSSSSGNLSMIITSTVTIPGNNRTSTIIFTFDNVYQTQNDNESITIGLSTPGCEGITIHKP